MNIEQMDAHIRELFESRWYGDHVLSSLENMKIQLNKTLTNQLDGYWSGHTAYFLAVDGGFLVDAKNTNGLKKHTTNLGTLFMKRHADAFLLKELSK